MGEWYHQNPYLRQFLGGIVGQQSQAKAVLKCVHAWPLLHMKVVGGLGELVSGA